MLFIEKQPGQGLFVGELIREVILVSSPCEAKAGRLAFCLVLTNFCWLGLSLSRVQPCTFSIYQPGYAFNPFLNKIAMRLFGGCIAISGIFFVVNN